MVSVWGWLFISILSVITALLVIPRELLKRWRDRVVDHLDTALRRRISRFDRRYREFVCSGVRFIDLKGLATVGFYTPELDEVFVDVSVAYRAPHQVPDGVLTRLPADVTERRSLSAFLDGRQPAVLAVLGVAGGGKTTLLRHLAKVVCQDGRGRRRTTPILLQLRDHVDAILSSPDLALPAVVRRTVGPDLDEPPGWFEQRLRDGDCVVLLDGLDEVARQEDRRKVADWVETQIRQYSRNDFVITSRPLGYREARINGATVVQVRNLTAEQVISFLRGWYLAVERHTTGGLDEAVRSRAESAADDLLERLSSAPGLSDLTANPLLLTMIANVHRYRGALPGSRAELYGEICQVMLWRRQQAKNLPSQLRGDKIETPLRALAYAMMHRRVRDLSRAEVLAEFGPTLRRMSRGPTAEDYLADVSGSGLFVERESGLYAFAHLTFQEYLAATHIRDKALVHTLTESVDDDWWWETALLYAARWDADPIVAACLRRRTMTALLLASDCVDQDSELAPELRDQLDDLLSSEVTPDVDPARRRVIAGVLVARHLRPLHRASDGGRVRAMPVTARIYGLYRRDVGGDPPDGPLRTNQDEPVTGVYGHDAVAFTDWVNESTGGDPRYRLPSRADISDPAVHGTLEPGRSVWLQPDGGRDRPELWLPADAAHPHAIDAATLARHVSRDLDRSVPTLVRLLLLRSVAVVRIVARLCAHTLSLAQGASGGRDLTLDLYRDHTLARALLRTLEHAHALDPARGLGATRDLAHDLNLCLARAIKVDNHLIRELTQDLHDARDLTLDLDLALDHHLTTDQDRELDDALALDHIRDRHLGLDLTVDLDGPAAEVMGSALSQTLARVLRHDTAVTAWRAEFSRTLLEETGAAPAGYLVAPDSLARRVHNGHAALLDVLGSSPAWATRVASRIEETASAVFAQRQPVTTRTATTVRLVALCLAAEADARDAATVGDTFREIAAGMTLLERRVSGEAPTTEAILLTVDTPARA